MINSNIYYKCKIESKTIKWIIEGQKVQQGCEFRSKAQGPFLDHTACKNMKTFPDALINMPACFAHCWYRISGTQTPILPGGLVVKDLSAIATALGLIPGPGRSLEKEMATHFSILDWEIPWTEESDRLWSMGLQRVGHDLVTKQTTVPQ